MSEPLHEHAPRPGEPSNPEVRHEPSDVSVRGVLLFAVGMIVFGVVVQVVIAVMFNVLAAREEARKASSFPLASPRSELPPTPRLEGIEPMPSPVPGGGDPDAPAWVDEKAGLVRMPVSKAIDRALEEGWLTVRKGAVRWHSRVADMPSDASSGRRTWGGSQ
jgi:hypothetical protein